MFRARGAAIADADAMAHEVLSEPAVLRRVARALRAPVTRPDGSPDRESIASLVFGRSQRDALRRLEAVLHPAVRRRLRRSVAEAKRRLAPAVVLEVPLLFEAGVDSLCDWTIVVEAPVARRLERVAHRGWTPADLRAREARMWTAQRRRSAADRVLRNGGTKEALEEAVDRVWREWIESERASGARRRQPS
jgi:dephospho-CoA kinase